MVSLDCYFGSHNTVESVMEILGEGGRRNRPNLSTAVVVLHGVVSPPEGVAQQVEQNGVARPEPWEWP